MLDTVPALGSDPWGAYGPWRYGVDRIEQAGGRAHLPHVQAGPVDLAPPWSPENPLFWFAAVLLATGAGMFAVSGSVRVAKTRASASLGEA